MIIEALDVPWVVLLSMDSFYKVRGAPVRGAVAPQGSPPDRSGCPQVLTQQQQEQAALNNYNFDHPDAFDFDLIVSTLQKLKQGKSVKVPVYDFTTHSRKKDWVRPRGPGPWRGAAGRGGHQHGASLCRRPSTAPTSSSSRASWPLRTRRCWR